jgi:hypothetical protein
MPNFAAHEARVNHAVRKHLSNAEATLPSGAVVPGMFDNGSGEALGMLGSEPRFKGDTADLTGLTYGASLSIGGTAYTVRENRPDGTGLTTLVLER